MSLVVITEANSTKITHVNKKYSDELLRKFADPADVDESKSRKPRKKTAKNSRENGVDIESNTIIGLVERKRLLLSPATKRRSLFLRRLASGKSHLMNKSPVIRTIGKTWRKTIEGASRVFIEKHYYRHRRLLNDVV